MLILATRRKAVSGREIATRSHHPDLNREPPRVVTLALYQLSYDGNSALPRRGAAKVSYESRENLGHIQLTDVMRCRMANSENAVVKIRGFVQVFENRNDLSGRL